MRVLQALSQKAKYHEELKDEDVVLRILNGETLLFEMIMRRFNQRLFRVAKSILQNDSEAEDVMINSRGRPSFQPGSLKL